MQPALHELLFGAMVVYAWNSLFFEKMVGRPLAGWRHLAVTAWGAGAFIINTQLDGSPLKMPLTLAHTLILVGLYVALLVRPLRLEPRRALSLSLSVVTFIAVFMAAESLARALAGTSPVEPKYLILIAVGMGIALSVRETFKLKGAAT